MMKMMLNMNMKISTVVSASSSSSTATLLTLSVAVFLASGSLTRTAAAFVLQKKSHHNNAGHCRWTTSFSSLSLSSTRSSSSSSNDGMLLLDMGQEFNRYTPIKIQGGNTLKTWSYRNPAIQHVQVLLKTQGRPLEADIQLWVGPDNTPHKMKVYLEDGDERTFHTLIPTPTGPNSIKVRNTGMLEFPFAAVVEPDVLPADQHQQQLQGNLFQSLVNTRSMETIQGGAIRSYPFPVTVNSVIVIITNSNSRPLNTRIELLQGPNNNKQVVEFYSEDGRLRPFYAIFDLPGSGNVVRIVNTSPMEFPLQALVTSYAVDENAIDPWASDGLVQGGGGSSGPMKW